MIPYFDTKTNTEVIEKGNAERSRKEMN